jgi:gluconolactonase
MESRELKMSNIHEITNGLCFPEGPVALPDGSILVVEIASGQLTKVSLDGNKTIVAKLDGGPNGAAIGPDGRCYICNNGGMTFFEKNGSLLPRLSTPDVPHGWIEAVDIKTGAVEVLYTTYNDKPLIGPNDIVFDAAGGFWFTDHGHTRRRDKDRGGVYYAAIDGSHITEVIAPMDGPNGIGISPNGQKLYVAETPTGRIWAFDIESPGKLSPTIGPVPWEKGQLIASPSGYHLFDSLAIDSDGNICVGSIPGAIDVFSPEGVQLCSISLPDIFPTNICFGGKDLKTAYITLSSSGKLVALDWPRSGLALNF